MTEDQDLMDKISQLAGQINRHKQTPQSQPSYGTDSYSSHHVARHAATRAHGWAPYRGRPYSRGRGSSHRNRTLILNNGNGAKATPSGSATPSTTAAGTDNDSEGVAGGRSSTPNGWVAKRDRHMQLINTAIYDQEARARTKAMEESRKAKSLKKAQIEQDKVLRYAAGVGGRPFQPPAATAASVAPTAEEYQVFLNDVPFRVSRGGSKLIRVSGAAAFSDDMWTTAPRQAGVLMRAGDPNKANNTPKRVTVAGVTFVRSKNGNLHRLGAVTSKRKTNGVKKNELCRRFTTTGTCYKGPSCLYTHDPNKVAICKDFLQTGKCTAGLSCDLSHDPSPHRSPTCMHFLRGRCANPACRYAHIRLTPGAPVCRQFANLGYCEKGETCDERHVHECPDYANTGVCNKKRCRLPHVDRAGQIRKNAAVNRGDTEAEGNDEEESDASSEDEEYDAIDSDDVDSDYLEDNEPELVGSGGATGNSELVQQQDFIGFSG